jgi:hypothetical protein
MNGILAKAVSAIAVVGLVFGAATQTVTATPTSGTSSGTFRANADGPSNCNCTGSDAQLTVCHVTHVTVTVNSAVGNFGTGQSESNCGSQTVPDGYCIYYRYNFECEPGFFWTWSCWYVGSGLKSRPATDNDC